MSPPTRFPRLLLRAGARHLARQPWQLALSLLGVALGVAVAVAVDLANASARRAFEISAETLSGSATHRIEGGSEGLAEALLVDLRVRSGIRTAAPIVEGFVTLSNRPERTLRLLGVDPLAEGALRPHLGAGFEGASRDAGSVLPLATLLGADAVVATPELAADLGLTPGGTFAAAAEGREVTLRLVAIVEPAEALHRAGLRDVLIADISTAQEVLGMVGRLSRIDVRLPEGVDAAALVATAPPGVRLEAAGSRTQTTLQMTRAFRINLRAMSLLAMLCGGFLIYNTMTFSVLRRRELLGTLRALGVDSGEIMRLVLGEALAIGLLGSLAGLAAGVALARGLVRLVAQTVNDLYFFVSVTELATPAASLGAGLLLGVGTTAAAAWFPALEATRVAPRRAMRRSAVESRMGSASNRLVGAAVLAAVVGGLLLALPGGGLLPAFAGLFIVVLAATLLVPAATLAATRILALPLRSALGGLGAMTVRGVASSLSRTAVAIAALMVAVSVVIGVGIMVASFRVTLVRWLDYTLQADLYVSPAGGRGGDLRLEDETRARLAALPGLERLRTLRGVEVVADGVPATLLAVEMAEADRVAYRFRASVTDAWARFDNGAVIVSEPFEARRGVAAGERLILETDRGPQPFEVAAVHYSYASDRGAITMRRDVFERWFADRGISGLSVRARPGTALPVLAQQLREAMAGQRLVVTTQRELRERTLQVFDRTFLITGVLRALVTLVAFVGVLGALMAIQIEGRREHALLRACGLTPGQLAMLMGSRSALLGLIAGALSLPLGLVLAWLMVHVINKRSFGWTLQMAVPVEILLQGIVVAVLGALLAGIYPALRMARVPPAIALREE